MTGGGRTGREEEVIGGQGFCCGQAQRGFEDCFARYEEEFDGVVGAPDQVISSFVSEVRGFMCSSAHC